MANATGENGGIGRIRITTLGKCAPKSHDKRLARVGDVDLAYELATRGWDIDVERPDPAAIRRRLVRAVKECAGDYTDLLKHHPEADDLVRRRQKAARRG